MPFLLPINTTEELKVKSKKKQKTSQNLHYHQLSVVADGQQGLTEVLAVAVLSGLCAHCQWLNVP